MSASPTSACARSPEDFSTRYGFDIKVIKGGVRRKGIAPGQNAEALHAQLVALRAVSDRLVVIFDEFQRLRRCPGEPLSLIRSALMGTGAGHVSLLFTGSIRNALRMMLEDSSQPLFGEAAQMQLPVIDRVDFLEYQDVQFEATGRPADETALDHLLAVTGGHPRRTQQLAWEAWNAAGPRGAVDVEVVVACHERLVQSIERSEFSSAVQLLANGDEAEFNELRALQLLADRGGRNVTSRELAVLYGFSSHSRVPTALERLRGRGLVGRRADGWYVVDPLFGEWLARHSPLGDAVLAGD